MKRSRYDRYDAKCAAQVARIIRRVGYLTPTEYEHWFWNHRTSIGGDDLQFRATMRRFAPERRPDGLGDSLFRRLAFEKVNLP